VTDDVTWPWKVKLVTPIRLERNISKTARDRDSSRGPQIGNDIWSIKWSRDRWRHGTPKVLWGITVGYPSDRLASCFPCKRIYYLGTCGWPLVSFVAHEAINSHHIGIVALHIATIGWTWCPDAADVSVPTGAGATYVAAVNYFCKFGINRHGSTVMLPQITESVLFPLLLFTRIVVEFKRDVCNGVVIWMSFTQKYASPKCILLQLIPEENSTGCHLHNVSVMQNCASISFSVIM